MPSQVGIPRGTRDFSPQEVARREYLFGVLRKHFYRYGYLPIETPAMENIDTLTGKYGDEGDQLLFKVRSEEHTSELQSQSNLVCRLLLEKKKKKIYK